MLWAHTIPARATEGSDPYPNPLMDEATLLSVLENLRPYPQ